MLAASFSAGCCHLQDKAAMQGAENANINLFMLATG